jgi:hypothetical protein
LGFMLGEEVLPLGVPSAVAGIEDKPALLV